MKRRRRHYYHCTERCHGETWIAKRKTPDVIGTTEPTTPRLCVCPTIAGCFSARLFLGRNDVYVYQTAQRRSAIRAKKVCDSCLTGERWIVPPVEMRLDSIIPADVVDQIAAPIVDRLAPMGDFFDPDPLSLLEKASFYARSLPILEAAGVTVPRREKELMARVMELLLSRGSAA